MVSINRLKAANLSFEAFNSQVTASHSMPPLDNHSMPVPALISQSPEESHPIYTRHKLDTPPHNCTTPVHSVRHFFDGIHVTTYPKHGLQTKRGRPAKHTEH